MTIRDLLNQSNQKLTNSSSPHLDSEVLLSFVLNKDRAYLLSHPEIKITKQQNKYFNKLIKQRNKNIPVAYIIGKKEFYNREFIINKNVLIPRPDTEIIIDYLKNKNMTATYCDVGTGSGAIVVTLTCEINNQSNFIASDINHKTLKIAKQNAENYTNGQSIYFIKGSLWKPYNKFFSTNYHMSKNIVVIANLPYLEKKYIKTDLKHEPKQALYAPTQGLKFYKKLLQQISHSKFTPEMIALEALPEQMKNLEKISNQYLKNYSTSLWPDLGGQNRYIIITK